MCGDVWIICISHVYADMDDGPCIILVYVNEWRNSKRNAIEISNDHLIDVMCIFVWIIKWLMDTLYIWDSYNMVSEPGLK